MEEKKINIETREIYHSQHSRMLGDEKTLNGNGEYES